MADKSVADVLNEAADIVARGWCQGNYFSKGACCVIGALTKACIGSSDPLECDQHLWRVEHSPEAELVSRAAGVSRECLASWNDEDDRTPAEVIAALREAAVLAR